ncbi:MAG: hypothetical protein K6F69_09995 [Treponema sp.]|nr:hypothetical protein [Treponema sp.]
MDKSANRRFFKWSRRLLNIFILFIATNFLFAENEEQPAVYIFKTDSEYIFTRTECQYSLFLKDIAASKVQFTVAEKLPEGVYCLSSKKTVSVQPNGESGTLIQVWFSFFNEGEYNIPSGELIINGKKKLSIFQAITVTESPAKLQPEVTFSFDKGINKETVFKAGEAVTFTIYSKYATHIPNINWNIPENALFKEIERYSITDMSSTKGKSLSPEKVPVIKFEWTPLIKGRCSFPKIDLVVISYNGMKYNLSLTPFFVDVIDTNNIENSQAEEKESLDENFAYAFESPVQDEQEKIIVDPDEKRIEQIAHLRSEERKKLPFSNIAKYRNQVEEAMGIVSGENEPSVLLPLILAIISAILVIAAIIALNLKAKNIAVLLIIFFTIAIISFSIFTYKQLSPYAIYIGGEVYPIPEEDLKTSFYIRGGSRVQVVEKTEKWVYIRMNNIEGWVPKNTIYPLSIKNTIDNDAKEDNAEK